ncbi:MAG: cyclic pyranopterin monophosphate synthase MoaC [Candidatus Zixiibacteriota bacterium]|nr:MAG: cyclic pyranopterin monophosphate synthase MoaC [candidate division Zixibacteria bacterium]
MKKKKLTHIGQKGEARMVDVGNKPDSERFAVAVARVRVSRELLLELQKNTLSKGDALAAARIAGIQAAKRTADIIPLCHTIPLTSVAVDLKLRENPPLIEITAEAHTHYKTGVEMEALTAVSVAALTIYDMGKAVDKTITIELIQLIEKRGGRTGDWSRKNID